ncbi:hypothetical protein [Vibrio scophthalmi]|uniref:Tail fiber protein n=1 Tax=Vibrio scophthalmi TaxID=45658 RepID=A0A1E3WFJ8_9VIBR|nr:hypothetical protein [Vibrio scophthalmi]ODS04302.1 hypothetical protein VSF3289_03433 [Vibrio scophthalmi]
MSALQAIPTQYGIGVLNSELKNTVTQYRLIGASTDNATSDTLYSFHTEGIKTSYYDEDGILTFILNLPIEEHFDEYLHRIDVIDSKNQVVIECPTPKIALVKGVGGIVTLKVSILGQAGDVIFKHGEYVTEAELKERYLSHIQFQPWDRQKIYRTGDVCTCVIDGNVVAMEMYAGPNLTCLGKDPKDSANRQIGWTDETAPWWWGPYKRARPGTPLWPWMSTIFPEGTLNVIGNSVPAIVFWRLALVFPEFINEQTEMVDFPETGGEFFRVLDQGRGVDVDRVIYSYQEDEFKAHNHYLGAFGQWGDDPTGGSGVVHADTNGRILSDTNVAVRMTGGNETRPRNLAFPLLVEV